MPKTSCQPERPTTFDLAHSPLEGFNLIDASAGTGKTYTICGLVLRLLLEKDLTIEQILVVTYTEAATDDLRDRVRQKLRQALSAIDNPPGDDAFLQDYLAKINDHKEAAMRLSEALRSFDEAAIFTIHGFCQRMLLENSFESTTLFDTELVADDSYLIQEIVEDFWRRIFSQSSDLFSQYAADRLTPETLQAFLRPLLPHPFIQLLPPLEFTVDCKSLSGAETKFITAYRAVCREWEAGRRELCHDLLHSPALKRNTYNEAAIHNIINSMDAMAMGEQPSPHLFEKFSLLTSSRIAAATKTRQTPNILPFYELCENLAVAGSNLLAQYDRCLLALKKRLLDSFRHELRLRKARDNVFSFDDLLLRLHGALTGPGGPAFARTIARKYPAALIDEFQDTDPLQFEIFSTIYHERSLLFLIGDPKQAIYSFRGADIFTYMDAAAAAPLAHHTLGVNHRSTPALVKAVNTLFCRAKAPFVFEEISFQPVSAAQKKDQELLTLDGQQEEPFVLWYLDRPPAAAEDGSSPKPPNAQITKTAARRHIISQVTAEICRLLHLAAAGRACINGRNLLPGDIAVLVRKNDEARKMQQALAKLQVPSVLHSGDDLFGSEEAKEMSLLLGAIAAPGSIRRVKTGLLTRFIGLQANAINLLQGSSPESEENIQRWLTKFRTYHDLWSRYGFMQMFWVVMGENRVRQRLLATENGERSLTNILHLAEILHQESLNQGLNITALLGYLQGRLAADQDKNIEHQLRLESDGDRVKIVTIHKAKGLEYPVVFCPFTWEGTRLDPKQGCLFHRRKNGRKTELIFDAGSPDLDSNLQRARQEEMAENLRLLYVAITRAVHRCYLVWGPINGAESSAIAYLLHQGPTENVPSASGAEIENALMAKVSDRFPGLTDPEILAELQDLAAAAEGNIRISAVAELPETFVPEHEARNIALRYRKFTGKIASDWKISSFSALTASRSSLMGHSLTGEMSVLDRDGTPAVQAVAPEQKETTLDIFSFPHGARPGTFLHELLELADFSNSPPVAEQLISEKLQHFGFETTWGPVISHLLQNLGNVDLHNDIPGLKLASIPRANCLHELEFYFPLSRLTPGDLKHVFSTKKLPGSTAENARLMDLQLDGLTFTPSRGFMRGFIDLVFEFEGKFYLLDWKSNYLGSDIEDYRQGALLAPMLSGFYFLQYHIYSLALHLYLKERIPAYRYGSHFGGIFYIFLRGINRKLGPGFGIYHDLPDLSTIERLQAKFLPGENTCSRKILQG